MERKSSARRRSSNPSDDFLSRIAWAGESLGLVTPGTAGPAAAAQTPPEKRRSSFLPHHRESSRVAAAELRAAEAESRAAEAESRADHAESLVAVQTQAHANEAKTRAAAAETRAEHLICRRDTLAAELAFIFATVRDADAELDSCDNMYSGHVSEAMQKNAQLRVLFQRLQIKTQELETTLVAEQAHSASLVRSMDPNTPETQRH